MFDVFQHKIHAHCSFALSLLSHELCFHNQSSLYILLESKAQEIKYKKEVPFLFIFVVYATTASHKMTSRMVLLFLFLLGLVMVIQSSSGHDSTNSVDPNLKNIRHSTDVDDEMKLGSESNRRQLYKSRYISYAALREDNLRCNKRDGSYNICHKRQIANAYRRGCTKANRCARAYDN
ncbi:protein RALF-like 19 [Olea europaea var. sylvestris]|uniref:protein RALF-like 19 n=1 Tax=Olea europaea var. sylvestris TaxID=158386 RepID=UPI000C1D322D|nr:protein RALF-like 19 [Olea europaea var. sylvestris]